uniref:hypothetical protein n=1 Tax=Endozoicomonas sp. ONNA1 TaxID=2828740 RepID=UPI0021499246
PLTAFGASVIPNLDLTLSRCEEALGSRSDAEKRLVKLRNMNPDADEEILCQHSHNFDADITNARLWQSMEKHQMAETLLVNMKKELTRILLSNRCAATAKTLHKQLQIVNIALVRLLQERGLYEWAEDLLLDMSGKQANYSEEFLCQPCGNDEIDLALLRLWELMCKHERVGRLLLNMSGKRLDGTEEDLFTPYEDRDIDLALALHWHRMGKYQWAERLLLNMSDKHLSDTEEDLCTPSGDREIDLALLRVWELQGKYKLTEKLLLNMINKHPDDSEDDLCRPSEDFMIDLTLVRHWQIASKFKRSERLLLNMSGKDPNACAEDLCQPCGNFDIDLNQALLWQAMGKSQWSERLLLNMSGKHPEATEEFLCKPYGHPLIDLAMARLWELTGKYKRCERLLLNIIGKHPDNNEENLCKPSGTRDIDLTLVRLWRMMNKKERSLKLLHRCCDLYHASECEYTLLSIYAGTTRFMELMSGCQESANTLLTCSIHYFRLATGQITDNDLESGRNNLKKALESVESALQKYPATAGAYSQKAHCLRMLSYSEGNSEDVWTEWFDKAKVLDPSRKERFKDNDDWRITEALAVKKLQDMAQQT